MLCVDYEREKRAARRMVDKYPKKSDAMHITSEQVVLSVELFNLSCPSSCFTIKPRLEWWNIIGDEKYTELL